ncbi:hypothetical protein AB0D24_13535 [Streptomyces javensis]|uniref:hypothetical protein n=1 Tax=Streptomyces javensis TaxID=114698 RepID=UPI0033CA1ED0
MLTGVAFVPIGVGVLVCSLGSGRMLAVMSARVVMILGLALSAAGLWCNGTIEPNTGFWSVVFPA